MPHQKLVPQQARPCDEADDEYQRHTSTEKLTHLVVNSIAAEFGRRDTQSQSHRNDHRFSRGDKIKSSIDYWGRLAVQWKQKQIERSAVEWAAQWDMSPEETARAVELLKEEHWNKTPAQHRRFDRDDNRPPPLDWPRLDAERRRERAHADKAVILEAFKRFVGRDPNSNELGEMYILMDRGELNMDDVKTLSERFQHLCPVDYSFQHSVSFIGVSA